MTSPRKLDSGQIVASLVSTVIVIAAAIGGSLALWAFRDQLPEVVATHWGARGQANTFKPVADLYVENAVVCGVMPLFLVVLGLVMKQGRTMGPIAAGTAIFMSGVINGTALAQRGMTPEQVRTSDPGWTILWTGLVSVAVAAGLIWLFRRRRSDVPVPVAVGDDAPRLLVDDSIRLAWTGRTPVSKGVWVALGLGALSCAIPMVFMAISGQWSSAIMMALTTALMVVLGAAMSANVTVDSRGVRVRSLGFITWATIPLETIAGATVGHVSPLGDFGGWGRRVGFNGQQGVVTAEGPGLRLDRGEEGIFVITVADAEAAAATVNTLVARRG